MKKTHVETSWNRLFPYFKSFIINISLFHKDSISLFKIPILFYSSKQRV